MHIETVPFLPEHFYVLELREIDALDINGLDMEQYFELWQANGTKTIFVNGQVAGIFGSLTNTGVGLIYGLSADIVSCIPVFLTKTIKVLINALFATGCHRVEAYCHRDNARSVRWLTRTLGFEVEGLMRKSGHNAQDRYILARLR